MKKDSTYQEIKPSNDLKELVHSFWMHKNNSLLPQLMTIFPDSFFKIIFLVQEGEITHYFMTGIWTEQKDFIVPAQAVTFGCRLRILAPEFLITEEIATILNNFRELDLSYLNIESFDLSEFNIIVKQWELELRKRKSSKSIQATKLRLSQLLYNMNGGLSVTEVSERIYWTNRQISRYLNKYLGVSLKKYLNIQKCYEAYIQIREGRFFPEKNYFDQAHFIREIKKHTGQTPKSLYERQNDRFIQLKNIKRK